MKAEERGPLVVVTDPDDPAFVWVNWCPLCGLGAAEHTEEACDEKLRDWRPTGLLGGLDRYFAARQEPQQ
jgi:hypothetical protein